MSEGVPKRKLWEDIEVMNTSEMQRLGFANREGKIVQLGKEDEYMVILKDSARPVLINGHSLRGKS